MIRNWMGSSTTSIWSTTTYLGLILRILFELERRGKMVKIKIDKEELEALFAAIDTALHNMDRLNLCRLGEIQVSRLEEAKNRFLRSQLNFPDEGLNNIYKIDRFLEKTPF
jgi:hypothetical protein